MTTVTLAARRGPVERTLGILELVAERGGATARELSVALGLLPYNFITVNAGAMLSSLRSTSDLMDLKTMGLLVLLALGMLVPVLLRKKAKDREVESSKGEEHAMEVEPNTAISKKTS